MPKSRDEDIETRAIEMAQGDKLEWVKRPQQMGQPATPDAATNAERDNYRKQARAKIDQGGETIKPPSSDGRATS